MALPSYMKQAMTPEVRKELLESIRRYSMQGFNGGQPCVVDELGKSSRLSIDCNISDEDDWCYDHLTYRCWNKVCGIRPIDDKTQGNWSPWLNEIVQDIVPPGMCDIEVTYRPEEQKYVIKWLDQYRNLYGYNIAEEALNRQDWSPGRITAKGNLSSKTPNKAQINRNGRALRTLRARSGN